MDFSESKLLKIVRVIQRLGIILPASCCIEILSMLSELVKNLKVDDTLDDTTREKINKIRLLHVELIYAIGAANEVFKFPLLFNQGYAVVCLVVSISIILFGAEDAVLAVQCSEATFDSILYPFMGEKISRNAEALADVICEMYRCQIGVR